MTDELLLGVDIGTASTKGVLTTPDGTIVAEHEIPHELLVPRPGWAEHDAERAWWGDFVSVCRALLVDGCGDSVTAVGVSGIGPCFCPADEAGRALRPAILYGVDTRATAEIEELDGLLGRSDILQRTGSGLTSQAVGPKLLWFRRNEPDLFARTRYLLPASSFLLLRLTGEYVVDRHTASGFNPLYDVHRASGSKPGGSPSLARMGRRFRGSSGRASRQERPRPPRQPRPASAPGPSSLWGRSTPRPRRSRWACARPAR